jgi:glycosyltransferase involved in cell wall biosynthesis
MKVALLTIDNREHYRDYGAPTPHFGTAPEALLQGLARCQDLEVHVISCAQQPVAAPEKLAPNLFFHSLHVPRIGWMRTAYLGCIRATRRRLRQIQPDVVHGQGTERDCALSAVFSGFPSVLTLHGNVREVAQKLNARLGSFHWLAARLEALALRRARGVFCNSEHTERLVRPLARKTWRVPNALREAFFQPPTGQPPGDRCVLLNVGVVCAYKRQIELVDAAESLRRQGLAFELQLIGRVDRRTDYGGRFARRMLTAERGGGVRFLGFKSLDEMVAGYDRAGALVHVPATEAFGLVVAEALARNLKFFGFRVGGIPDIAAGAEGAELVEDGDWAGLMRGVERWIRAGHPRPTANASLMRQRYHPDAIARRHLEIYREVLSTVS